MASEFKEADLTVIKNPTECQAKLESLQRLANNTYYQESDANIIPSTGLLREEIEQWTSSEGLEASKNLEELGSKTEKFIIAMNYYKDRYLKKNQGNVVVVNPHEDTKKLPKATEVESGQSVESEDKNK